jgi:hypothetical protein
MAGTGAISLSDPCRVSGYSLPHSPQSVGQIFKDDVYGKNGKNYLQGLAPPPNALLKRNSAKIEH